MREAKVFEDATSELHKSPDIPSHRLDLNSVQIQVLHIVDLVKSVNCLFSMVFPPKIVQITQDFKTVKINDC